jgi:hypothetical protein
MESIIGCDGEVKQGWAHFRCDVCLLAYNTEDLGYVATAIMCKQGRYTSSKIEVCVECVEYIGGNYDGM